MKDRIRYQRISYEVIDDNRLLRDFVKRLANMAETALAEVDDYTDGFVHTVSFSKNARDLIREARAAIGENAPRTEEKGSNK